MTPILQSLHWLPVKQRILYKIGILSFHRVRGDGPAYLTEMFSRVSYTSGRTNLRSATRGDFVIPRTNTMTFGPRSFRVSGPTFRNMLPLDMRDMNISPALFKSKLKTFLFMRAFPRFWDIVNGRFTNDCLYYTYTVWSAVEAWASKDMVQDVKPCNTRFNDDNLYSITITW